jgi:hypothetical protein
LGLREEARVQVVEVLRLQPSYTIQGNQVLNIFQRAKDREHYLDGLRKAGLPER